MKVPFLKKGNQMNYQFYVSKESISGVYDVLVSLGLKTTSKDTFKNLTWFTLGSRNSFGANFCKHRSYREITLSQAIKYIVDGTEPKTTFEELRVGDRFKLLSSNIYTKCKGYVLVTPDYEIHLEDAYKGLEVEKLTD